LKKLGERVLEEKEKGLIEEYRSGLTPRAFIIGIILVIIICLYNYIAGGLSRDPLMRGKVSAPPTLIILFILALISPLMKKKGFTESELTVIYTMMASSLGLMVLGIVTSWPLYLFIEWPLPIDQITPPLWFPPKSVVAPMRLGGAPVPWDAWILPLAFWILLSLSVIGFVLTFGVILSHRMINVEKLPFPMAQVMMGIISNPEKPLGERYGIKSLTVGFIIGFLLESSFDFFPDVISGFPRFWPIGTAGIYRIDFGPVIGPATSNMAVWFPVAILTSAALYFFIPTKILGSAILTSIIIWDLIPYAQVKMGIMTNVCALGLYDLTPMSVTYFGTLFEPSPIQVISFASTGFVLGTALTYIVLSGKDILGSFKSAVRGEKIGQVNCRAAWLGFIGSIILFLILTSLSGIPLHSGLFILVISLLIAHGWQRARGYVPISSGIGQHTGPAVFPDMVTMLLGGEASRSTIASYASQMTIAESIWGYTDAQINYAVLDGFRLCELTKTKWGDVLKSSVIATVLSVIILFVVMVWGGYTWGYRAAFPGYWFDCTWPPNGIASYQFTPGGHVFPGVVQTRVFPDIIAGIIVSIIITAISFYLPWFPLHPIGLIWGAQLLFPSLFLGPTVVAFIARVLVLKIGGAKLYEKAIPVAIGVLIGSGISNLIYGLVLISRII